jgi:hypothetical protein
MATDLKERIRLAAIATPALTAVLGTNPFRWYDTRLVQGSAFPAVVAQVISNVKSYVFGGRLPNSHSRVQFTLWAQNTSAGITALGNLERTVGTFLDSLNLIGISGLLQYPNRIVLARDGFVPTPEPGNSLRLIDVMMASNDSL